MPRPTPFRAAPGREAERHPAIVENLKKAKADQRITGVIVSRRPDLAYWARLQEVRDAIADFKSSGKPVVAHLEYGGDREYFVASACDKVFLLPTSRSTSAGSHRTSSSCAARSTRSAPTPTSSTSATSKTAPNQFTEKTFTPAHREMAESLNRDLFEQFVQAVAAGRKKTPDQVRQLVDDGPFLAEDAVRVGLVDDLAYDDQIDAKVRPGRGPARRLKDDEYAKVRAASVGLAGRSRIAVINAYGVINSGRSGIDPLNGAVVGSDTLVEYIRKARKGPVESRRSCCTSTARAARRWRPTSSGANWCRPAPAGARPLVVSMSDLAASAATTSR